MCVRDFSLEHQCHPGLEQSALDEISGVVQPAGQIAHEMTLSDEFLHDIWVFGALDLPFPPPDGANETTNHI